ncbi:MAG: peptide chain release factor 1 [Spirochaetes bacterium]|nr:MAG: peptide chain release factor 1 [Spirochaetota bacterium]
MKRGARAGYDGPVTDRLQSMRDRLRDIELLVADPGAAKDQKAFRELMKERSRLSEIEDLAARAEATALELDSAAQMVESEKDGELKAMAQEEVSLLEERKKKLEEGLEALLAPRDPLADKPVIVEIRAGTGGDEAALFAADLYRMYSRYADGLGWKAEVMSESITELGGFKEIVFSLAGDSVYERLRWESGVHRVQRVPATENSGRIHTSAVTVAVLPEMEETEIDIKPEELRIDVMRSGGPGGQSVNTTDSAVRITHLPTGIIIHCQDEKSQIKNKAKAMRILRARLFELEEAKLQAERSAARKSQVGSGDRSERIRTYNFPQNRLTDHRIDLTLYKLDLVMEGDLGELVGALVSDARRKALEGGAW